MNWTYVHFSILRDLEDGYLKFNELSEVSQHYIIQLVAAGYSNGFFLDGEY